MRLNALIITILMAAPSVGQAEAPPAPAPPASPALSALLDTLQTQRDPAARLDAAKKLAAIRPVPVEALAKHLARRRASSDKDRRKALRAIRAEVPDHKGKFRRSKFRRKKQGKVAASDKFDWLAKLVALPASTAALGDVIVDVAIIRALAQTRMASAGYAILDFGFDGQGLIYRDECGRYLRHMAPYSIPALIEGAGQRRNYSLTRYSIYQLERLDRQSAEKAINAAGSDPALTIALLGAFGKVRYRDAVRVVWSHSNHHAAPIRVAARKSWLRYVSGTPPRSAPKRKLTMTGGEKTAQKKKLWLNSRELARVALEAKHEEIFKRRPREDTPEDKITEKIFAHMDAERLKESEAALLEANKLVGDGNLAGAAQAFDQILAARYDHPKRAAMAPTFFAYGKQLAAEGDWTKAAASFRKSNLLAPKAETSTTALAWHHYALARAIQGGGGDGKPELRKALALDPSFAAAKAALAGRAPAPSGKAPAAKKNDRTWMLYAGVGGGGVALLLLGLGLFLRRR